MRRRGQQRAAPLVLPPAPLPCSAEHPPGGGLGAILPLSCLPLCSRPRPGAGLRGAEGAPGARRGERSCLAYWGASWCAGGARSQLAHLRGERPACTLRGADARGCRARSHLTCRLGTEPACALRAAGVRAQGADLCAHRARGWLARCREPACTLTGRGLGLQGAGLHARRARGQLPAQGDRLSKLAGPRGASHAQESKLAHSRQPACTHPSAPSAAPGWAGLSPPRWRPAPAALATSGRAAAGPCFCKPQTTFWPRFPAGWRPPPASCSWGWSRLGAGGFLCWGGLQRSTRRLAMPCLAWGWRCCSSSAFLPAPRSPLLIPVFGGVHFSFARTAGVPGGGSDFGYRRLMQIKPKPCPRVTGSNSFILLPRLALGTFGLAPPRCRRTAPAGCSPLPPGAGLDFPA